MGLEDRKLSVNERYSMKDRNAERRKRERRMPRGTWSPLPFYMLSDLR